MTMTRRGTQRGFILLLTVLVLALAGVVFAAAARHGFQWALSAQQAQQSLQRRWAAASASGVVLPAAEELLAAVGSSASLTLSLTLGSERYQVVVADEGAKLHALTLEAWIGRSAAERLVREVVRACGSGAEVRLRRYEARVADGAAMPMLASYSQVFAQPDPAELSRPAGPGGLVTCWGDGRLNYMRASEVVLRGLAASVAGPLAAGRLVELRERNPRAELEEVLGQLKLDENRRQKLDLLLSEDSSCHSIWLSQRGGRGSWHYFAVQEGDPLRGAGTTYSFLW